MFNRKKKRVSLEWFEDDFTKEIVEHFSNTEHFKYLRTSRIFCYKTTGSTARAYARTYAMPKIFQRALGVEAAYVIECISEHFDKLSDKEKKKVIIHELLHIPKNFSGTLKPHGRGRRSINSEMKRIAELMKL